LKKSLVEKVESHRAESNLLLQIRRIGSYMSKENAAIVERVAEWQS
jgi:hypothetical protein